MVRVDVEVEAGPRAVRDKPLKISSGASIMAPHSSQHEVAVGAGGQMVRGRAVPEMGVDDHAQSLEVVEVPVDGREVHFGRHGLDLGAELLRVRCPRESKSARSSRTRELVTRPPCSRSRAKAPSTVSTPAAAASA